MEHASIAQGKVLSITLKHKSANNKWYNANKTQLRNLSITNVPEHGRLDKQTKT